jgi:two-component system cell cycle sensor histidine kinase/response regulator CckA
MPRRLPHAELIDHVEAITWEADAGTLDFSFVSRHAERVLGYPVERWLEPSFWVDHLHPTDRERAVARRRRVASEGQRQDFEYRMVGADGRVHWLREIARSAAEPALVHGVLVEAAQEPDRVEHALRACESQWREAEQVAHLGYWENDLVADRITWSDETYRILGLVPGAALPGLADLRKRIHPDDRRLQAEVTARAHRGEGRYDLEYRIVRPDGEVRTIRSVGDVELDGAGRPRRAFGIVQDVTEWKQLEAQLRQAQKMEAVGRLAGGVAHDFNNFLTVISTCSGMVLEDRAIGDASRELVDEIQAAGERAANLTRQLMAFSRVQPLKPQVVDVHALFDGVISLLARLLGEHIELSVALEATRATAKLDPGQFEQAMLNLAVNARDAMPGGGRLSMTTRNAGDDVVVAVTDTGHGMSDEVKARIFEPFFTTKGPGEGTGLGLAMVYGFVTQSGGRIQVHSAAGAGTTFEIALPVAAETAPSRRLPAQVVPVAGGAETILLVEDEDAVRRMTTRILAAKGYRILEARDGVDALAVAARHGGSIDIVVTDSVMPRMSGPQLVEALTAARPGVRILVMSGYLKESDLPAAGLPILPKPFSAADLTRRVREILDA